MSGAGAARPPRLARHLLAWAARRLEMPALSDDAGELYAERVTRDGERAARGWYHRQTAATLVRLLIPSRRSRRGRRLTAWVSGLALDFRLGFRMLVKYPGLTLVGGLAMAFAILVGAIGFELVNRFFFPALPLEDGERIVAVDFWDSAAGQERPPSIQDFVTWRERLVSVEDLGAVRGLERNLIALDGSSTPVRVTEVSATAFQVARVAPILGRPIVAEEDERPGAAPVVVVSHTAWQKQFAGDSSILGQTLRLDRAPHTVVGVMPEDFWFPTGEALWVPLRPDLLRGRGFRVFGRLADGATLAEAQAELTAMGWSATATGPGTRATLRPRIQPYAKSVLLMAEMFEGSKMAPAVLLSIQAFLILLVVVICGNVALLMFARAATRESEIVVRNALGASRRRIIGQLFSEALVLAGVGAAIGLIAADLGIRWKFGLIDGAGTGMGDSNLGDLLGAPRFWDRTGLAPLTVVYACVLTVIAAVVAGVVPALEVTRGLGARLRQVAPGGGGFRFGGVWTAVVVAQVAAMVALPVLAFHVRGEAAKIRSIDFGFPVEEFLSVGLVMDRETGIGGPAVAGAMYELLKERLEAEPAVVGVTFAESLDLMRRAARPIELDEGGAAPRDSSAGYNRARSVAVANDYLDLLNAPILAGRGFHSGDVGSDVPVVLVNQSFVDRVLGGLNPIGRRVRYVQIEESAGPVSHAEPWYEIIGVVRDIGRPAGGDQERAGIYHPAAPGSAIPAQLAVHVRGDPQHFVPRLRSIAAAVDPTLRLRDVIPLDEARRFDIYQLSISFWLVTVVSGGAMLLSLAGIYAVLSFTVSQRTREIGIRRALGGQAWPVAASIGSRPLAQVAVGVILGAGLTTYLVHVMNAGLSATGAARVVAYVSLMVAVCMIATIVPVRRALRIEPTEALKADT